MENKFRVWCANKKEWEQNECFLSENGDIYQFERGLLTPMRKETHLPSYYTGLKDKNGVEIYEGDVVTWERPFGNGMGSFKVGFGDGCFGIFDRQFLARVYVFEINESCEVIGNIYQNGNLLNG